MERRKLGKTGLDVSVIGFGSAPIGLLDTEQQKVGRMLNQLLDAGVNLIDTAAMYHGSEEAIGKAVSDRRDDYILVSKCGQEFDDLDGDAWSPTVISQTVDRALERLQTDHLDVMLLHSCDLETLETGDALGILVEAREAGKVRFVGYSGDNEAARYAATLDDVAVVETSISICDQANFDTVLPTTRKQDVGVVAKRPIANAAWKKSSEQPGFYKEYADTYSQRLRRMQITPSELGFQGEASECWPEIALRFTLSEPGVHAAIVGTTDPEHVAANLRAAEKGPLPDETAVKIRQSFQTAQERAGECWTAQT
ncbi:MAG: aldo/keto reductase [Planctomycetaceae bacterium]|nr:aldo/keto reductase [Planctomycetaceae bacterium]